jgi:hypothetical protein
LGQTENEATVRYLRSARVMCKKYVLGFE